MGSVSTRLCALLAGGALALGATAASAAVNIIPTATSGVAVTGTHGVLRPGSPWGPGSSASDPFSPVNGLFEPENQQWNLDSFWWDEDPAVNAAPVQYRIDLDGLYTINRFVVQADDNDSYLLEYWDGGAWQVAWAIGPVFSFGLVTRDSGLLAPVTTSQLRFTATGGDNYYSVSEIQAFAVPEPTTWALMIGGFGLAGAMLRKRRGALAAVG